MSSLEGWLTTPAKRVRGGGAHHAPPPPPTATPKRLRGSGTPAASLPYDPSLAQQEAEEEIASWLHVPTAAPGHLALPAMVAAVPRYVKACMDKVYEWKTSTKVTQASVVSGVGVGWTWYKWTAGYITFGPGSQDPLAYTGYRTGSRVHVRDYQIRLQVFGTAPEVIRFTVLRDRKNAQDVAPTLSDLQQANLWNYPIIASFDPRNVDGPDGPKRYEVLVDERFVLKPNFANETCFENRTYNIPLNFPVTFNSLAPCDEGVWIGVESQEGTASAGFRMCEQARYTDA